MNDLDARLREDARNWRSAVDQDAPRSVLPRAEGIEIAGLSNQRIKPQRGKLVLAVAAAAVVLLVAAGVAWLVASTTHDRQSAQSPATCLSKLTVTSVIDFQSIPTGFEITFANSSQHRCRVLDNTPRVEVIDDHGARVGQPLTAHTSRSEPERPAVLTVRPGHKIALNIDSFVICRTTAADYSLRVRLSQADHDRSISVTVPVGRVGAYRTPVGSYGGSHVGCLQDLGATFGIVSYLFIPRR